MHMKEILYAAVFLLTIAGASAALTDGVLHYYKLDTDTKDILGTLNGVDKGTLIFQSTINKINGTAYFDNVGGTSGANASALGASSMWNLANNNFTIAGWIYFNSSVTVQGIFVSGDGYAEANSEISIFTNAVNSLAFQRKNSSGTLAQISVQPIPVNQWQYFAFTYNGTAIGIWRNGTQLNTTASQGAIASHGASSNGCLGIMECDGSGDNGYLNGYLDEWGFWNGTWLDGISQSSIYNGGSGCSYPFTACTYIPATINVSTDRPVNGSYQNNTQPFTFITSNVISNWNVSLYLNGSSKGSNNTINTSGTFTIYPSGITAGSEYTWLLNASNGTFNYISNTNNVYITGGTSTSTSCITNLGNAYYRPNTCTTYP
jgi:hypothetical protein